MGHIVNSEKEYRLLQQRLDYNLTGAPYSPVFIDILKLLFSPEEAAIARHIPLRPTKASVLAKRLNIDEEVLAEKLARMAERGLVLDFEYQGSCHIVLAPVVIGFFEFVFMRTRGDLPMQELAALFDTYMKQDDQFAMSVFEQDTQIGRALVREEALPTDNFSEILDWEKATHIVANSRSIGVSLCACRHKASHIGKDCGAPQRTCLTFGHSADMLIDKGMAERIEHTEALAILEDCKARGLVQIADNVQRQVGFICNCCGCCCGMLQSIRRFDLRGAVVTSNWLPQIGERCVGCGACVKACPVDALHLQPKADGRKLAVCDEELCLGCGVCHGACRPACLTLKTRPQRVYVPETTFDRYVAMAIERGKLSHFLFDDPSRWSHRALGRIARVIERSSPVQALLAVKPLRSAFMNALTRKANGAAKE